MLALRRRTAGTIAKLAVVAALAAILSGCSSFSAGKYIDAAPAGTLLPEGTPARPAEVTAYPAVHDMPPPRTLQTLSESDQEKAERDLVKVRDRQEAVAGTTPPPDKKELAKKEKAKKSGKKPDIKKPDSKKTTEKPDAGADQ